KDAKLECRHQPEKSWTNGGTAFHSPEEISASRSRLAALNDGLLSIRYIFRGGRLDEIRIDRLGHGDAVIAPLQKPLRLREGRAGSWIGLEGTIVVCPSVGNAEH